MQTKFIYIAILKKVQFLELINNFQVVFNSKNLQKMLNINHIYLEQILIWN